MVILLSSCWPGEGEEGGGGGVNFASLLCSVLRNILTVMEHIVTYVETCLVRFIQDTFHSGRNTVEGEIKVVSRHTSSRLEYDFQSRPIEMLSGYSRQAQSDSSNQQVTSYQADTSSDEELSSTEHLPTVTPTFTKRKRKILRRKSEFKDQLIFGIEI